MGIFSKKEIEEMRKAAAAEQRLIEEQRQEAVSRYNSAVSCDVLPEAQKIGCWLKSIVADGVLYEDLSRYLDKLSLPDGYALSLKGAQVRIDDCGDRSRFYVEQPNGETTDEVFRFFSVEDSAIGALQAYLLYKMLAHAFGVISKDWFVNLLRWR